MVPNCFGHSLDLQDMNRLTTLIKMSAAELAHSLADSGHSYALTHASSSLLPLTKLKEEMMGMTQVWTQVCYQEMLVYSIGHSTISASVMSQKTCIIFFTFAINLQGKGGCKVKNREMPLLSPGKVHMLKALLFARFGSPGFTLLEIRSRTSV